MSRAAKSPPPHFSILTIPHHQSLLPGAKAHKRLSPWKEECGSPRPRKLRVGPSLSALKSSRISLEHLSDGTGGVQMVDICHEDGSAHTGCDCTIIPVEADEDHEICYGALYNAQAAYVVRFGLDKTTFNLAKKSTNALRRYSITSKEGNFALWSPGGKAFALLDFGSARILQALQALGTLRLQATMQPDIVGKHPYHAGAKATGNFVNIAVNLYGSASFASKLGALITRKGQFLQHPDAIDPGIKYMNPQFFETSEASELNHLIQPRPIGGISKDTIIPEVGRIMDSLDSVDSEWDVPVINAILTLLLSHQEAALRFIRQKEDWQTGEPPECRKEDYKNSTSQSKASAKDQQACSPTGGILADMMGLGKTLTLLSAIVHSLDEGRAHPFLSRARFADQESNDIHATSATLVVVPSAQLIEVWKPEISRHIAENLLRVAVFHGANRINDPQAYTKCDLVLTTYSTLVKDSQKARILHRLSWFRVILDEAHWIRNQDTEQFRSTNSLHTYRRWCLTGTPIQNRLEDLGALVRFLKVPPFDGKFAKAEFQRCIVDPLFLDRKDPCHDLRELLRSVLLRRTSHHQSKLTAIYQSSSLTFSVQERCDYEKILTKARLDMDKLVKMGSSTQKYTKMFAMILRLRMFCALGQQYRVSKGSLSWLDIPQAKSPAESDLVSELGCDLCQRDESLDLLQDHTFCPGCSRLLERKATSSRNNKDESSDTMDHGLLLPSDADDVPTTSRQPSTEPQQPHTKECFPTYSYPTKLFTIADRLYHNIDDAKSIVFSCWTKTLDVLGMILDGKKLRFVRIDGNVNYSERQKRLLEFQTCSGVSILLMTFGTGAVGLNLTEASHIHLVEPQWNPTVEAQAIGRALRLGQKREVKVFRYVMRDTVEQSILDVQKKKEKLSTFAFDGGLGESMSEKLQEFRFILQHS